MCSPNIRAGTEAKAQRSIGGKGRARDGRDGNRSEGFLSTRINDSSGSGLPDKRNGTMTILQGNKRFVETQFKLEKDLEELVRSQSKILFGENTIFITKRKLKGLVLGNTIPDGFLFDLTEAENPEFYLVEFELQQHDFNRHICPQITKFFGFFRNTASQNNLAKNLFSIISADLVLKSEFKKYLGEKEISMFLMDACENSQNILLVIDGEKVELTEIMNTCTDTWGKLVKIMKVKAFTDENETLVSVEPEFVDIQKKPGDEVLEGEHLTTSQRAMYAAEISMRRNSDVSMSEAAKKMNISRVSAHIAKKIKLANPALAKLVKSGKMSLNEAGMKIATPTRQEGSAVDLS